MIQSDDTNAFNTHKKMSVEADHAEMGAARAASCGVLSGSFETVSGPSITTTPLDPPKLYAPQSPNVAPASIILPVKMSVAAAARVSFSEVPPCSNGGGLYTGRQQRDFYIGLD